jgi:5-deoxy-glucuronate isomerase
MIPISPSTCIIRNTASRSGRTVSVAPGRTAARHLHYGRIILDAGQPLSFHTDDRETGLIGLKGSATVTVEGRPYELGRYDALYVPRDRTIALQPGGGGCDLAEVAACVESRYPVQFVAFDHVQKDSGLHFTTGGAFGIQLVYTDPHEPELATIVREGDVVLMPQGYHPNVAAPGSPIKFLWMMAAHRERDDRQFGVVNVQPEFAQKGSGLEAARK